MPMREDSERAFLREIVESGGTVLVRCMRGTAPEKPYSVRPLHRSSWPVSNG
jgi:hypothetical protein